MRINKQGNKLIVYIDCTKKEAEELYEKGIDNGIFLETIQTGRGKYDVLFVLDRSKEEKEWIMNIE